MNNYKMILSDSTEIALAEFTLPMHIVVNCATNADVLDLWDQLTQENLTEVEIQENGEKLFTFFNAGVVGQQCMVNPDGSLTTHFYLEGEREALADPEYEQAGRILLGEES